MSGVSGTGRAPDGGMDAAGRPGERRESAEATSRGERTREHAASVGPAGATGDTDPTRRPEAAGGAADATSPETMREQHITVPRTARYYTLGRAGPELGQVWFVCHGYGQLAARFIRRFRGLDNGRRLIVAPEALSRFYLGDHGGPHGPESRVGATWMTREDRLREIDDYVRYLDLLHDHVMAGVDRASVRVVVLGFSQGTATVARWVTLGRVRPDELILWAGGFPPDLDLQRAAERLAGVRVRIVAGEQDRLVTPRALEAEIGRLRAHGLEPELIRFDGGHQLDPDTLGRLADEGGGGRPG